MKKLLALLLTAALCAGLCSVSVAEAPVKTAMVPVHDKMASRIGKETIESFYQAVDFKK